MAKTNNTTLSLTTEQESDLKKLAKLILGKENKTGLVVFWINENKHRLNQ